MGKAISLIALTFFSISTFSQSQLPILKAKLAQSMDDYIYGIDDGPEEFLPGCSWYCGPGHDSVSATSELAEKSGTHTADLASDFNLNTAWVEGKQGDGLGEKLTYTFAADPNQRLGVNQLIVLNGYYKSEDLWKKNSRVKQLKMYVDGKAIGIVELEDSRWVQLVDFPVVMFKKDQPTTISFEIMSVYPGTKYQDTAITELVFDGVGVH